MKELRLRLPHLELAAVDYGPADGIPLLALHGWLDNAASFETLAPLLPGHRIVALDWPGHGRSQHRPDGAWYHYIDYLHDLDLALDALGWERCRIVAHSLGGAIASVYAAARPERVERLALIEALGPISTPPEKALGLLRAALTDRIDIRSKSLRVFPDLEPAIKARMKSDTMALSREAAARLVTRGTRAVDGGFVWSSDPRLTLTSAIRLTEEQVLAYLAGLTVPTLAIMADPPFPFVAGPSMQRRMDTVPALRLLRIPGTHHLHLENPASVAGPINAFFAEAPAFTGGAAGPKGHDGTGAIDGTRST